MSHPYTDRFGNPLTSVQALRRMQSPQSTGYYNERGEWVKRELVRTPAAEKPKEVK